MNCYKQLKPFWKFWYQALDSEGLLVSSCTQLDNNGLHKNEMNQNRHKLTLKIAVIIGDLKASLFISCSQRTQFLALELLGEVDKSTLSWVCITSA